MTSNSLPIDLRLEISENSLYSSSGNFAHRGVQTLLPPFSGTPKVSQKLVRATFLNFGLIFSLRHEKVIDIRPISRYEAPNSEDLNQMMKIPIFSYFRALGTLRTEGYRHCYPRFQALLRCLKNLLEPLFLFLVSSFHCDTRKSSIFGQYPDMRRQTVQI